MAKFSLIAGPNGAGKSTLAQLLCPGKCLNPDIFATKIKQILFSIKFIPNALVHFIGDLVAMWWMFANTLLSILVYKTFAIETVLATKKYIKHIKLAKLLGYSIHMYFIILDNPNFHIERVQMRVKAGGHNVAHNKIVSRWHKSIQNLVSMMPLIDNLYIYENIENNPILVMMRENNEPIKIIAKERLVYLQELLIKK